MFFAFSNSKKSFSEYKFAKKIPGEASRPPPVALRALPYTPYVLRCVASHHFAQSCATQKFSISP